MLGVADKNELKAPRATYTHGDSNFAFGTGFNIFITVSIGKYKIRKMYEVYTAKTYVLIRG